jgi:MFS family permease
MTRTARRRDFGLLWFGDTVNALGTSITVFVLPVIAVSSLHATVFQVGLLATARWLPALLLGLPAGAWTERAEKRRVLLACNALSGAAMAAVPVLAAFAALPMAGLYTVVAVAGALAAVFNTAYIPYFSVVLDPAEYRRGISRIMAARTAAQLCGPALGGILATLYRPSTAVWADVGSFAVVVICLARLPQSTPVTSRGTLSGLGRDIREGISYLRRDPYLSRLTVMATMQNLLSVAFGAIEVVFLLRTVQSTPRAAGYLLAFGAAGSIIGAATVPRVTRLIGAAAAIRVYLLVLLPASTLICLTQRGAGNAFFIAGELAMALALTGFNAIVLTFRQARVPALMLGRVSATMQVCLTSAMPLGGLLGGALAEAIGTRDALWVILPCTMLPGLILLGPPFSHHKTLPLDPLEPSTLSKQPAQHP